MPDLYEVSYSREATITAFREYYRFLTRMYLNERDVIEPPEGGWPEINAETFRGSGKTNEVISLLRHLPYIRASDNYDTEGAAMARFADWQYIAHSLVIGRSSFEDVTSTTGELRVPDSIAPHVFGLTDGGIRNPVFMLDTKLGIVYYEDCHSDIKMNPFREPMMGDEYDNGPEDQMDWRVDSVAWPIPDFFEVLKDQFRRLNYIPVSPHKVCYPRAMGGLYMVQAIYRAHGWPYLERYHKRDCLKAVQDLMLDLERDHKRNCLKAAQDLLEKLDGPAACRGKDE